MTIGGVLYNTAFYFKNIKKEMFFMKQSIFELY